MNWATRQCLSALFGIILTAISAFAGTNAVNPSTATISITPTNLAQLLALSPEQLDGVDIARMNLLCTEGLPGAEDVNVPQLLKTLDSWALWIGVNTKRHHYRFETDPKYYNNSEGDFRMAILSATLQQQYGVQYSPARAEPQMLGGPYAETDEAFFADPRDIFINGLLSGKHYGTCSSMPLLFVAVAQRLGYPVHLAMAKNHFIVRYDEGVRHFNVEATSPGYAVHGDEYYKEGMKGISPTTDAEAQSQHLFQPMNGREVLAACLDSRSACFNAAGQLEKAREAALAAHKLAPYMTVYKAQTDHLTERIEDKRKAAKWDQLLADIQKIIPPEGDKFDYFRDKKIYLQIHLYRTADLDGTEKGLAALKQELAAENPPDTPAKINLSPMKPHEGFDIVVMPEKAAYTTMDGETIEILVKSPEQLAEFFIEQRVLDKVAEISRHRTEIAGVPAPAGRPTSIQFPTPPGMTREERLRMIEAELDQTLAEQNDEMPPKPEQTAPNPLAGIPLEIQEYINAANAGNGFNRLAPGVPNLSNFPLSPEVQHALDPLDRLNGFRQNPSMQGLPPGLPPEVESALRMRQLLQTLPPTGKTNQ